ncbi:MAG: hypothetical protein MJ252_26745 [archaeon]|nr:hypothetical protein [archaeon]
MGQSTGQYDPYSDYLAPFDFIDEREYERVSMKRIWIFKKAINVLGDNHSKTPIDKVSETPVLKYIVGFPVTLTSNHWALIIELDNGHVINVQFGSSGTSLRFFRGDDLLMNIRDAVEEIWGVPLAAHLYCFLGTSNKPFNELYKYLKEKKEKEKTELFYNPLTYNSQDFIYEMDKFIFARIRIYYNFGAVINRWSQFLKEYFPGRWISEYSENYIKEQCERLWPGNLEQLKTQTNIYLKNNSGK